MDAKIPMGFTGAVQMMNKLVRLIPKDDPELSLYLEAMDLLMRYASLGRKRSTSQTNMAVGFTTAKEILVEERARHQSQLEEVIKTLDTVVEEIKKSE